MQFWALIPLELFKWILMAAFIYMFFVVLYLTMFNLVVIGFSVWSLNKLWIVLDAWTDRIKFKHVTTDLIKYVKDQQEQVYKKLEVDIGVDKEGSWIEFTLSDEKDFEKEIANRRKKIFAEGNDAAIKDMKDILAKYQSEKEKGDDSTNK